MAKLHKKKNSDGYHILDAFPNKGARYNVTYQITHSGLELLEKKSLLASLDKAGPGEGIVIPQSLLNKLRENKCLYTGGSGAHGKKSKKRVERSVPKTIPPELARFPLMPNGKFMHIRDYCLRKTNRVWDSKHQELVDRATGVKRLILDADKRRELSAELDALRREYHSVVNKPVKRSDYPLATGVRAWPRVRAALKGRVISAIEEHDDRIIILCRKS